MGWHFGAHIIGPYFLPGNFTGELYLDLLENTFANAIVEENRYRPNNIIFRQDGAIPHYAVGETVSR